MKRKFKLLIALMSLSLTLGLMSNTYSRYVAGTSGNIEMKFTKWQILVNENDITNGNSSSIELTPIIEENANIAKNTIAPSSKGYFDIDIDPTNTELSFNYTVSLELLNENMPDLMITKYALLDTDYQVGDEIQTINIVDNHITGSLNITDNENGFKPFTIRIYFEWFEGENEKMDDTADSQIGNDAAINDTSLQIKASVKFEQKTDKE